MKVENAYNIVAAMAHACRRVAHKCRCGRRTSRDVLAAWLAAREWERRNTKQDGGSRVRVTYGTNKNMDTYFAIAKFNLDLNSQQISIQNPKKL